MQRKLSALREIVSPEQNYHGYRVALGTAATPKERDACIPWLALHLKELEKVLQQNPSTIEVNGRQLLNFKRYNLFVNRLKEVARYSPPNLEEQRDEDQLGYLVWTLRAVGTSEASKEQMLKRSGFLMEQETADRRSRKYLLQQLGFDFR